MPTARPGGAELPLPPQELLTQPEDDDRFRALAREQAALLRREGLRDGDRVADLACGPGRLAIGLLADGWSGRYDGVDVLRRQVEWAAATLTPMAPTCSFTYADVRNRRYNPRGAITPDRLRLPFADGAADVACLLGMFTHLPAGELAAYLRELRRVVRPGGTVVTTWFLFDEGRLEAAQASPTYPMRHRLDDVTLCTTAADPLRAIAFDETFVRELAAVAGLEVAELVHGQWAGGPGPEFPDVLALRAPAATLPQRLGASARGLRRRVLSARA